MHLTNLIPYCWTLIQKTFTFNKEFSNVGLMKTAFLHIGKEKDFMLIIITTQYIKLDMQKKFVKIYNNFCMNQMRFYVFEETSIFLC